MISVYKGSEPYAFVSYSHKDTEPVLHILEKLNENGVRFWYDEGIEPGSLWANNIASHIEQCHIFIAFISRHYLASENCVDELIYARDHCQSRLLVFLDDMRLESGLAMRMNRTQNIRYSPETENEFFAKISASNEMKAVTDRAALLVRTDPAENTGLTQSIPSGVRTASYEDLIAMGYTSLQIAQRLVENDYALYPDMSLENEGTPEQWAQYLSSYPDTFFYVVDSENRIVGNWSFLAVSEQKHMDKLLSGELTEESFRIDETEYAMFEGEYIGYLLNLSMNIGYNSRKNINMLVQSFMDHLTEFARDGVFFKAWYVNVFRPDHEAMYRRMGFRYITDNRTHGKLYGMYCDPFPENSLFSKQEELRELYGEYFG